MHSSNRELELDALSARRALQVAAVLVASMLGLTVLADAPDLAARYKQNGLLNSDSVAELLQLLWGSWFPDARFSRIFTLKLAVLFTTLAVLILLTASSHLQISQIIKLPEYAAILAVMALAMPLLYPLGVDVNHLEVGQRRAALDELRGAFRDSFSLLCTQALLLGIPVIVSTKIETQSKIAYCLTVILLLLVTYAFGWTQRFDWSRRGSRVDNEVAAVIALLFGMVFISSRVRQTVEQKEEAVRHFDTLRAAAEAAQHAEQHARADAERERDYADMQRQEAERARIAESFARAEADRARVQAETLRIAAEHEKHAAQASAAELQKERELREEEQRRREAQAAESISGLRAAQEAFKRAAETRENFLGAAAHDLSHCLTSVSLWADLVQRSLNGQEASKHHLDSEYCFNNFRQEVDSLERAFRSILEYSERAAAGTVTVSPVRLRDVLTEMERKFLLVARAAGVKTKFVLPSEDCFVLSDRALLSRVVLNLISNAIKYTKDSRRKGLKSYDVVIRVRMRSFSALLLVMDRGIGISGDNQHKIYEPGYQVSRHGRNRSDGYGLGLATVKTTIERSLPSHKVNLMRSSIDVGSIFSLAMPLAFTARVDKDSAEEALSGPSALDGAAIDGALIYLVEDDPRLREATKLMLQAEGAFVRGGETYNQLVADLESDCDRPPDLLITDFQLDGDRHGGHVIDRIRDIFNYTHVPCIVWTANPQAAAEVVDIDSVYIISKATDKASLLRRIRSILAGTETVVD